MSGNWSPLPSAYLPTPSTTLTFDTHYPLLYTSAPSGHLTSYFCHPTPIAPSLSISGQPLPGAAAGLGGRYTAWKAAEGIVGEVEVGEKGVLSVGGGVGYAPAGLGAAGPLSFSTTPLVPSGRTVGNSGKAVVNGGNVKGTARGGSVRFHNRRGVSIWSVEYVVIPLFLHVPSALTCRAN